MGSINMPRRQAKPSFCHGSCRRLPDLSNAPKGNGIGATGS